MSSLIVKVTTIDAIKPHTNADALELAIVGGWQCVVPKNQYRADDKIVYFPPDTVLPAEVSDRFGVTKYLSNGRIRCAKLRGEPSFGLVVTPDEDWPVGMDVAAHYGATKYAPPVRFQAGDAETPHPLFAEYTEIENLRNFPNVLQEGEEVIVSEKLHGTNCRVALIEGRRMAGSHRLRHKEPENYTVNTYWYPLSLMSVWGLLHGFYTRKQVILFGEVYGKGIQNLQYGQKGLAFAAFDLMVEGKYLDHDDFIRYCTFHNVPTVPILACTTFSLETIKQLATGKAFAGGHIKEGVVVKPVKERTDPSTGRVIFKYISDAYLLRQKEDFTDQ